MEITSLFLTLVDLRMQFQAIIECLVKKKKKRKSNDKRSIKLIRRNLFLLETTLNDKSTLFISIDIYNSRKRSAISKINKR